MNKIDINPGWQNPISTSPELYLSAPLTFVGQKRMFAKHFIEVIWQYPSGTVFVDLIGGSVLLSHITKHFHPESRVAYYTCYISTGKLEGINNILMANIYRQVCRNMIGFLVIGLEKENP